MAQFYQINFTQERQSRIKWVWMAVAVLTLCLAVGVGLYVRALFIEAAKPLLQPRLSQYQSLAQRSAEVLSKWQRVASAYDEIRPFRERASQTSPCRLIRIIEPFAAADLGRSLKGEPCRFLPEKLTLKRAEDLVLIGSVALPETDKREHCTITKAALLEAASNAVAAALAPEASRVVCSLSWAKDTFTAEDETIGATLRFSLSDPVAPRFPPPFKELSDAVAEMQTWRDKARHCKIADPSGHSSVAREAGPWLDEAVVASRPALGDNYAAVDAFAKRAVDPLAVVARIREQAQKEPPSAVGAFETAWKTLVQRKWHRETALDSPALDAAISNQIWVAESLPRMEDLAANAEKAEMYCLSVTNAVSRKNMVEEETFWDRVIDPCVTGVLGTNRPPSHADIAIDGKASRLTFPLWEIVIRDGSRGTAAGQVSPVCGLDAVSAILENVETNSAGTWVTSVEAVFDTAASLPETRWHSLRQVQIKGLVPCWLGDEKKKETKP